MNDSGSTDGDLCKLLRSDTEDEELLSDDGGGRGCSDAKSKSVSAPTMPPMECPIRMTWTEGSTVGDGVRFATSRSMTLSCSL